MTLFIDTETSGLPPKGADWRTDYNEFPYILSVCWKVKDETFDFYVNNEGVEITPEITDINGITQKTIALQGNTPGFVFKDLISALLSADKIVAHNAYFDSSIIKANVLRYFGPESVEAEEIEIALHKDKRTDTIRLAQKKFGGKYMSLSDLYFKLFGETFEAHSALNDVIALERVYNELTK